MRPSKGIQHPDHHHLSARTKRCDRELAHAPTGSPKRATAIVELIDGGLSATTATQDAPTETDAAT
jgi:hypothetical protein